MDRCGGHISHGSRRSSCAHRTISVRARMGGLCPVARSAELRLGKPLSSARVGKRLNNNLLELHGRGNRLRRLLGILGLLGFPPFAVECFVMYETLKAVGRRLVGFRQGQRITETYSSAVESK